MSGDDRGHPDLRLRRTTLWLRGPSGDSRELGSSLFARLSPSLATSLRADALSACRVHDQCGQLRGGWSIISACGSVPGSGAAPASAPGQGRLDFLPLIVRFDASLTIFVSYNGGAVIDERVVDRDVLELPSCLVPEGIPDGHEVQVAALASIQAVDILKVEPLTGDDWELLNSKGSCPADGLLGQVCVVFSGQELPLWVDGKDAAWIRVLPESFSDGDGIWPSYNPQRADIEFPSAGCRRLFHGTQIQITPIAIRRQTESLPHLRVYPTKEDYSRPMLDLAKVLQRKQVLASPNTVVVHPSAKQTIAGLKGHGMRYSTSFAIVWNSGKDVADEYAEHSCVVRLEFCEDVPEHHVAIHFLTRERLHVVALVDFVVLKVLSPVEVARESALLSQLEGHLLATQSVTYSVVRRETKWRYPKPVKSPSAGFHLITGIKRKWPTATSFSDPLEHAPFLSFGIGSDVPVRQGTLEQRRTLQGDAENNLSHRQFSQGSELQPHSAGVISGSSMSAMLHHGTKKGATVAREILLPHPLVCLLPDTSTVPAELMDNPRLTKMMGDAIVYGRHGSGKTHTALILATILHFRVGSATYYLNCERLSKGYTIRMKHILAEIKQVFFEAASCRGSAVVVLDDLDKIAPSFEDDSTSNQSSKSQVNPVAVGQAKLICDTITKHIEKLVGGNRDGRIFIIITCLNTRSLDPSMLATLPLALKVGTPTLTYLERESILCLTVAPRISSSRESPRDSFSSCRIPWKSESLRPRDLLLFATRGKQSRRNAEAPKNSGTTVSTTTKCVAEKRESFPLWRHRSTPGWAGVDWSDIGGLFDLKMILTRAILNPARYSRVYEKATIRLPRGVVLFGRPGCGKSHVVPALARTCGFALVTCSGPELLDRYIGGSEYKVRELFIRAAAASPTILFFDELDSLACRRGSDRTGVTDRIVNQLLTLLDGAENINGKGLVYVVAATSRLHNVDPALLRPGRLDKHVYVGCPLDNDEYTDVLYKIASRYSVDDDLLSKISTGEFLCTAERVCPHFHNFSGADLKAMFDTALLGAIEELSKDDKIGRRVSIRLNHLTDAVRSIRPALPDQTCPAPPEAFKPLQETRQLRTTLN